MELKQVEDVLGVHVLGSPITSLLELSDAVERGLPKVTLRNVASRVAAGSIPYRRYKIFLMVGGRPDIPSPLETTTTLSFSYPDDIRGAELAAERDGEGSQKVNFAQQRLKEFPN